MKNVPSMRLSAKVQSVLKNVQPATNRPVLHPTPLTLEAPCLRIGRVLKGLHHEGHAVRELAIQRPEEVHVDVFLDVALEQTLKCTSIPHDGLRESKERCKLAVCPRVGSGDPKRRE